MIQIDSISFGQWLKLTAGGNISSTRHSASIQSVPPKLSILYDKHFPKRRGKLKYDNKMPWLSEGSRNAIKQKNKL